MNPTYVPFAVGEMLVLAVIVLIVGVIWLSRRMYRGAQAEYVLRQIRATCLCRCHNPDWIYARRRTKHEHCGECATALFEEAKRIEARLQECRQDKGKEKESLITLVESLRGRSSIGPSHVIGWNGALDEVVKALKEQT